VNNALPTGRSGQTIAVLLVLLVLVVVWRLIVGPLISLYEERNADIANQALLASRMESLARLLPNLKADPDVQRPPAVLTIAGGSDAVAAATLQGGVQDLVNGAGGTLGSVEILPGESVQGLRRVGLKVTLTAGMDALVRLLAAIRQSEPPMLIDEMQIHGNILPIPGSAPAVSSSSLRLDMSFVVYGYRTDDSRKGAP
jgi:hypothetical protein